MKFSFLLHKIHKKEEVKMGSTAKKTSRIRDRKKSPNKKNLKADRKRIQRNIDILKDLAAKDE